MFDWKSNQIYMDLYVFICLIRWWVLNSLYSCLHVYYIRVGNNFYLFSHYLFNDCHSVLGYSAPNIWKLNWLQRKYFMLNFRKCFKHICNILWNVHPNTLYLYNKYQQDELFIFSCIRINNLYIFLAGILLVISRYYTACTAVCIFHVLCRLATGRIGVGHIPIAVCTE
jgi:hypothetical protein